MDNELLIYQSTDGSIKVDVRIEQETVWLTQKSIARLFGVEIPAISKHLKNIYESGELRPEAGKHGQIDPLKTEEDDH